MAEEQKLSLRGLREAGGAAHRPGASSGRSRKAEFERLQQLLACMRMVCDTPLHPRSDLPRLPEARGARGHLDRPAGRAGPQDHHLLRMGADAGAGARARRGDGRRGCAWHTGSVPQNRRRAEINRFKHDPACRVVPLDRLRQRRPQSPGRERRDQPRSAVEPGEAGAADRAGLAQEPDASGLASSTSSPRTRSSIRSCI